MKAFWYDAQMKQSFKWGKKSIQNKKYAFFFFFLLDKLKATRWVFRKLSINFYFCYEANHEKCQLPEYI